jgi:serine protease
VTQRRYSNEGRWALGGTDGDRRDTGKTAFSDRAVVVVKFVDEAAAREIVALAGLGEPTDPFVALAGLGEPTDPFGTLARRYPGILLRPVVNTPREAVDDLIQKAMGRDPEYRPAAFFTYYYIDGPVETDLDQLAAELREWQSVETAYVDRPGPDPIVNAGDDPRSPNQGYLDPAPDGIDAEYAWTITGGDGAGQRVIDLERGWTLDHEDLVAQGATLLHGTLLDTSRSHGTSVLGEICSVDNALGCVGIVPNLAAVHTVSYHMSSRADAIFAALANMSFGDVLLLEAQVTGSNGLLAPIEVFDAEFDAIRLATALGIAVVEAGGNGDNVSTGQNLDTYTNAAGRRILDPSSADFRDSGAVIATAASSSAPHTRMPWAPFGARINCYGWGQNVDTCASSDAGATNLYTGSFNGTSSASPIVTGAALAVQGVLQASRGYRFSPKQLREVLSDPATGTHASPSETTAIGVLPNLRGILDNVLGIAPDVYVRDFVGDAGEPHTGAVSSSPDVIVLPSPVADPQASYGAGSGTESTVLPSIVEFGQDNTVYVRALNQGGSPATNVQVSLFWSQVASLVTPNLWNLIGTTVIPNVPVGNVLTVSPAITWHQADLPAIDTHACFVVLIGTTQDPAPERADFMNWDNFVRFVRENNNVTWRNFNVEDNDPAADPTAPEGFVALPFLVAGPPDVARPMRIEVVAALPEGSKLALEAPIYVIERLRERSPYVEHDDRRQLGRIGLHPNGKNYFGEILLPARSAAACRLLAHIPAAQRKLEYQVAVRQLWNEVEVGRVTWRLAPHGQKHAPKARDGRLAKQPRTPRLTRARRAATSRPTEFAVASESSEA